MRRYASQREATHQYYARRDAHIAKNKDAYNAFITKLNENPDRRDIERGDALNAILDQLNDPRIQSSTLRSIDVNVNASYGLSLDVRYLYGRNYFPGISGFNAGGVMVTLSFVIFFAPDQKRELEVPGF